MDDRHGTARDLGRLFTAAADSDARNARLYAERIAGQLGIGRNDGPVSAGERLAAALGVPGPRAVTFDMADHDTYTVLTLALEELAVSQRERALNGGDGAMRLRRARRAGEMRQQAVAAWEARNG